MQEKFEFVRLVGNERRVVTKLADVSQYWQALSSGELSQPVRGKEVNQGVLIRKAKFTNRLLITKSNNYPVSC
jgi:hypothetical protein